MSNVAMVSFKMEPEHYAVLKAMAEATGKSLSEFVRETLMVALELELQQRRMFRRFVEGAQELS